MLKVKCLILDHDDTVVNSTKSIHYPAFLKTLSVLRPDQSDLSQDMFVRYCYDLGFEGLCNIIFKFTPEEMLIEYEIWKSFTHSVIPDIFNGMKELILKYEELGGYIVVVSHSESIEITRDYLHHFGLKPDLIYGWELGEAKRKPHPYPLIDTMEKLLIKNSDCLMIDDMRFGQIMSEQCEVPFACAGWSISDDFIAEEMKRSSKLYFSTVEELSAYLFD